MPHNDDFSSPTDTEGGADDVVTDVSDIDISGPPDSDDGGSSTDSTSTSTSSSGGSGASGLDPTDFDGDTDTDTSGGGGSGASGLDPTDVDTGDSGGGGGSTAPDTDVGEPSKPSLSETPTQDGGPSGGSTAPDTDVGEPTEPQMPETPTGDRQVERGTGGQTDPGLTPDTGQRVPDTPEGTEPTTEQSEAISSAVRRDPDVAGFDPEGDIRGVAPGAFAADVTTDEGLTETQFFTTGAAATNQLRRNLSLRERAGQDSFGERVAEMRDQTQASRDTAADQPPTDVFTQTPERTTFVREPGPRADAEVGVRFEGATPTDAGEQRRTPTGFGVSAGAGSRELERFGPGDPVRESFKTMSDPGDTRAGGETMPFPDRIQSGSVRESRLRGPEGAIAPSSPVGFGVSSTTQVRGAFATPEEPTRETVGEPVTTDTLTLPRGRRTVDQPGPTADAEGSVLDFDAADLLGTGPTADAETSLGVQPTRTTVEPGPTADAETSLNQPDVETQAQRDLFGGVPDVEGVTSPITVEDEAGREQELTGGPVFTFGGVPAVPGPSAAGALGTTTTRLAESATGFAAVEGLQRSLEQGNVLGSAEDTGPGPTREEEILQDVYDGLGIEPPEDLTGAAAVGAAAGARGTQLGGPTTGLAFGAGALAATQVDTSDIADRAGDAVQGLPGTELPVPEGGEPVFGSEVEVPSGRVPFFSSDIEAPDSRTPVFGSDLDVPEGGEPVRAGELGIPDPTEQADPFVFQAGQQLQSPEQRERSGLTTVQEELDRMQERMQRERREAREPLRERRGERRQQIEQRRERQFEETPGADEFDFTSPEESILFPEEPTILPREFPTGGQSVVGGQAQRVQEAEQSSFASDETTQQVQENLGVGSQPNQLPATGTLPGADERLDQSQDSFADQDTQPDVAQNQQQELDQQLRQRQRLRQDLQLRNQVPNPNRRGFDRGFERDFDRSTTDNPPEQVFEPPTTTTTGPPFLTGFPPNNPREDQPDERGGGSDDMVIGLLDRIFPSGIADVSASGENRKSDRERRNGEDLPLEEEFDALFQGEGDSNSDFFEDMEDL